MVVGGLAGFGRDGWACVPGADSAHQRSWNWVTVLVAEAEEVGFEPTDTPLNRHSS
jgi:hypothetical protein